MISRVLRNLFTDYSHFPLLFLHSSIKKCALHMERREGEKVCVCVCVHFYTDCVSHSKNAQHMLFTDYSHFPLLFLHSSIKKCALHMERREGEKVCVCLCVSISTLIVFLIVSVIKRMVRPSTTKFCCCRYFLYKLNVFLVSFQ